MGSSQVQKQEPININHRSAGQILRMKSLNKESPLQQPPSKKPRPQGDPEEKPPGLSGAIRKVKEHSQKKSRKVHRKNRIKSTEETRACRKPKRRTRYAYNFDSSILDSCSQYNQGKQIKQEFIPDQQLSELSERSVKLLTFKKKPPPLKNKILEELDEDIQVELNKLKYLEFHSNKRNTSAGLKNQLKVYHKANQLLKTYPFTNSETHYLLDDLTELIANGQLDLTSLEFEVFCGLLRKVRRKFTEKQEEKSQLTVPKIYHQANKSQIVQIFTGSTASQPSLKVINQHSVIPATTPSPMLISSIPKTNNELMNVVKPLQLQAPTQTNQTQAICPIVLVPVWMLQPSNSFELERAREKY